MDLKASECFGTIPLTKNSTPIGQVLTTVLQADVENLKSQGIHIIVAGLRDDNPADWQVLVLGNLDLIVGTNSTSAMLNFRPFQYKVHDILSNVTGKCQSLLCDLQHSNTPLDKLHKKIQNGLCSFLLEDTALPLLLYDFCGAASRCVSLNLSGSPNFGFHGIHVCRWYCNCHHVAYHVLEFQISFNTTYLKFIKVY